MNTKDEEKVQAPSLVEWPHATRFRLSPELHLERDEDAETWDLVQDTETGAIENIISLSYDELLALHRLIDGIVEQERQLRST